VNPGLSRRRFISVIAAAAGYCVASRASAAEDQIARSELLKWQGRALGAETSILISAQPTPAIQKLIRHCVDEIRRLELIFSLYQNDSILMGLNRLANVDHPPSELVDILIESRRFNELTNGSFDPTVQPLWDLYATHFSDPRPDPMGPAATEIVRRVRLVDFRNVVITPQRIAFAQPGMAITLNGIAQGYITDRVVKILRDAGMSDVLVDIGETAALGEHPEGRPWRVGLANPQDFARPFLDTELRNEAVATSGGYGMRFDANGRFHHLFDPRTGRSGERYLSVTVVAPRATAADALSTSFSLMAEADISATLSRIDSTRAIIMTLDGSVLLINSHRSKRIKAMVANFTCGDC